MGFIGDASFSVAEYYLGFFVVSFLILALILLSGLPGVIRKLIHAFRLMRARRRRGFRMLADGELLDEAGETLTGLTFFAEDAEEGGDDQEAGEISTFISDAA